MCIYRFNRPLLIILILCGKSKVIIINELNRKIWNGSIFNRKFKNIAHFIKKYF